MEFRVPLETLPLINGQKYEIRTGPDGRPLISFGGSAIIYFGTDPNGRDVVIKELFPRNCAYRKSDGSVTAIRGREAVFNHNRYLREGREPVVHRRVQERSRRLP